MQKLCLFVIMDAFVHFKFHLLKTGNGVYTKKAFGDVDKVAKKKREQHPHE